LRHSCGYKLANDGIDTRAIQDWLGHVSITHTTRYTQLSTARFKDFGDSVRLSPRIPRHRGPPDIGEIRCKAPIVRPMAPALPQTL